MSACLPTWGKNLLYEHVILKIATQEFCFLLSLMHCMLSRLLEYLCVTGFRKKDEKLDTKISPAKVV